MKKYIAYIALIPLVLLALTPPWVIKLDCTINSLFWLWAVFASGFLALSLFYFRVSIFLKLFVLWCFLTSFLSRAPYLSFTMYWSVIACAYYYVLCLKIKDFTPVKRAVQMIFLFVVMLIIMQLFGKDTLLNFNQKDPCILGTIGNRMILSSFVCSMSPFLIASPLNWIILWIISFISYSSGSALSLGAGLCVYAWIKHKYLRAFIMIVAVLVPITFALRTGDMSTFFRAGRLPIWKETVRLSKAEGYGVGTYKLLFPVLCKDNPAVKGGGYWEYENTAGWGLAWRRAHNCWIQLLFETGYVGLFLFAGFVLSILVRLKDPLKLAGLVIIGTNMMIHFPTRMAQSVLIILMFLAYCTTGDENGTDPIY